MLVPLYSFEIIKIVVDSMDCGDFIEHCFLMLGDSCLLYKFYNRDIYASLGKNKERKDLVVYIQGIYDSRHVTPLCANETCC